MENKKANLEEILLQRKYDPNFIPEKQAEILTINESIVGTLQNFVIITGGVKVGKSSIIAGLIASSFNTFDVFKTKITLPTERRSIAYFDTEMSLYDFYRQMERIKKLSGRNNIPEFFHAYNFREETPADIIKLIDYHLQSIDTPVIIIDGLLDLLYDFNDPIEAKKLINTFKKWTKIYNTLIIAVLHQSKGNDKNTLGHLGSATDRYCQSTIEVIRHKEKNIFSIEARFLRSDKNFDPVLLYNNKGEFYLTENEETDSDSILANRVLQRENNYEEVIQTIIEVTGSTKATAKKKFKSFIDKKLVKKSGNIYIRTDPFAK